MFDSQVDVVLVPCVEENRFVVRAVPVSAILGSVRGGFLAFIGFKWELPVWSALASLLNCPAHNRRTVLGVDLKPEGRIQTDCQMADGYFLEWYLFRKPFLKKGADEICGSWKQCR